MSIPGFYTSAPIETLNTESRNELAEYEYKLQNLANVPLSNNFQGVRDQLAWEQVRDDYNNFFQASDRALSEGANPEIVAEEAQNYLPNDTSNRSLEYAAAENQTEEALVNDELTLNNVVNDLSDDDTVDRQSYQYQMGRMYDKFATKGFKDTAATLGMYVVHGLTGDISLTEELRRLIPSVEWGDAESWENMHKAYVDQWYRIYDSQGYIGLSKWATQLEKEIEALGDPAARAQMIRIMQHDVDGDDIFAGAAIFGAVKAVIPAAKLSGNVKKAANLSAISDDIFDKTSSAVKKTSRADMTVNYANSEQVSKSLLQTSKDKEVEALINKYRQDFRAEPTAIDIDNLNVLVKEKMGTDVKLDVVDYTDAVQDGDKLVVKALFGNGMDKQGAMTKKAAENLANKLQLSDYNIVKKDGAGYYIQKTVEVDAPLSELSTAEFGTKGFGRMFYGSSNMPAWFHEELLSGYRKATKMQKDMADTYGQALRKLNSKQKEQFRDLYTSGQRANGGRGTWYNTNILVKEGAIDTATADAYNAFRKVSDIDYIISNDRVWGKLSKIGYVNDTEGDIVKIVKEGITKTPNYSQMIIKYGDDIISSSTHSAEDVKALLKDGNVLVELAPISVKGKEKLYTHKIISPNKLSKSLSRFVLPYRSGGRRRYAFGTNFLKIGQTMNLGGEKVNAYSKILGATNDAREAADIANEFNRALDLIQEMDTIGDTAAVARKIESSPFKILNISNTEDLKKIADHVDVTQRVQVVKEGESMVYNNGLRTLFEDPLDYDTSFAELAHVKGTFYNERGDILENLLGEDARLVDPFDIFDQTVQRAANNNSLGALYEQMGKIFKDKYIDFIDTRTIRNPRTLSGEELLRYAKLKDLSEVNAANKQNLREAINMQRIYQRLTNVATDTDKYLQRQMSSIAGFLEKTMPITPRYAAKIAKTDPFAFGRAILFQTTMGCFNLKQLWAQGMGAINFAFAHPVTFTRALLATPFVVAGKFVPGAKGFSKALSKLTGLSGEDYEGILKYMDEMGTTMGTYRLPMTESVKTYRVLEKTGQVLRIPVEIGTNFANIVNDIAAYIEAPIKDFKKIASRADDFAMNQTKATMSAFQSSQILPTKTIAQFTSYPFRVLENMTVNGRLSTREKLGVALGQIAMWGATGTLLNQEDASNVNRLINNAAQNIPEEVRQVFLNGIITTYLREHYGLNAEEPIEGAKLLSSAYDMYQVAVGEEDIMDFELPGAFQVGSRITALAKAAWSLVYRSQTDNDWTLLRFTRELATDPKMASGLRNLSKAFYALQTQKAYNTTGKLIKDDVTSEQSVGMMFGLGLLESRVSQELYTIYNNMQKTVKTVIEDSIEPIVVEIGEARDSASESERLRLANKLYTAVSGCRQAVNNQYGSAGIREFNREFKKLMSRKSISDTNEKFSRQYGYKVLQYLSDLFYQGDIN